MSNLCSALAEAMDLVDDIPNSDKNNKNLRWDVTKITPDIMAALAKGDMNAENFINELLPTRNQRLKVKYNKTLASKSVLTKDSLLDKQRQVQLAFATILDTLKAYEDIASNRNVDTTNMSDESGRLNISFANVAQITARRFNNSIGAVIAKGSPEFRANLEYQQGTQILQLLEAEGIIKVIDDAKYIYNGQRNPDGSYRSGRPTYLTGKVIQLSMGAFKGNEFKDTSAYARTITRLLTPAQEILPNAEPSKKVDIEASRVKGVYLTENKVNTFQLLSEGPRRIHKDFVSILKLFQTKNDTQGYSESIKSNIGFGTQDLRNELFGVDTPVYLNTDTKQSDAGVARTKSSNLMNVLDNLDTFIEPDGEVKEFFYDYYSFRTDRSLAKQNVLQPQTDKHFARAITTHGSVEVNLDMNDEAFKKVVGLLVEDYGVSIKLIKQIMTDPNSVQSDELTDFINVFRERNDANSQLNTLEYWSKNKDADTILGKANTMSLWNKVKALGILADLMEASKSGSKTFNMTHDVAPDASGSGLFINMLQSLSNSDYANVEDTLKSMGFLRSNSQDSFEVTIDSLYSLVANKLKPEVDLTLDEGTRARQASVNTLSQELDFIKSITNNSLNERDLAKYPVMKMGAYNQSQPNALIDVSKDLAWMVIKASQSKKLTPDNFNKLKERMLEGASSIKSDGTSLTTLISEAKNINELIKIKGHEQALVNYFLGDKNIAEELIRFTNEEVKEKLFASMNADISSIFSAITAHMAANNISMSKLKVLPPQVVLDLDIDLNNTSPEEYAKLLDKYGLPLTKRVEVLTAEGLTVNKEVANEASFVVSTTHMADAAIQHTSLYKSLQEYKVKFDKTTGVIPIHDAVNSDPHFAVINDKNYIEATFEVNSKWDKVQALLLTARALGVTDDGVLGSIESKLTDGIVRKQKVLTQMREDINESTVKGKAKIFGYRQTTETNTSALPKAISLVEYSKLSDESKKQYEAITEFFKSNPEVLAVYEDQSKFEYTSKDGKETIQITKGKDLSPDAIVKYMYHEVVHANTWNWLVNNQTDDKVEFLTEAIKQLDSIDTTNLSKSVAERFNYIKDTFQKNNLHGVAELVAIAEAEPEFKDAMIEVLGSKISKSKLQAVIDYVIKAVTDLGKKLNIKALTKKMESNGIDATNLFTVTALVHEEGKLDREIDKVIPIPKVDTKSSDVTLGAGLNYTNARNLAIDYAEYIGQKGKFDDPFSSGTRILNEYARNAIMMSLQSYGTKVFEGYLTKAHKENYRKYPIYKTVTDYLNDAVKNEHIQQIMHYMNLSNFKDVVTRTRLLGLIRDYEQERNKIDSSMVADLDAKLSKHFNEKELSVINDVYGKIGLFNLNQDAMFMDLISGKLSIDDAIVTQILKTPKTSVVFAENLAELYLTGKVNKISLDNVKNSTSKTDAIEIDKLVALYGLKKTNGIDVIKDVINKTPEAHTEMIIAINGIKSLLDKLYTHLGSTSSPVRGNVLHDIFESNFQIIPVTLEDFNQGLYNQEWQILREPKIGAVGLVYRVTDATTQPGLTTSSNFHVDGLVLSDYLGKAYTNLQDNNAVYTYSGVNKATKIMFTEKEKATLGIVTNPAHTIYRAFSHLKFLMDTQPIRDDLVSKTFTMELNDKVKDGKILSDHIKNEDIEHPWFLKLNKNVAFKDLPKEVQQRYKPVTNITSLGRMAEKVTHVRVDIAPWLVGYKDIEIMEKSPKLNKLAHAYRKLFTLQKIHWVIVNPVKVSKDILSNFTYLVSRNVPIAKIYSYSKQTLEGLNRINALRNEALMYKVQALGLTGAEQVAMHKKVEAINKKINTDPFAFIIKNGYLSSLSTDIVLKDTVTVSGLQHDIENLINKTMRTNKGELNTIGKFIMSASRMGVSTEDILNVISTQLGKFEAGKGSAKVLGEMANNLTKIKEKDDIGLYISQFIASPGSEVTKLGSAAIQTIEVVTKSVLHMHNKDMGMTEDETVKDVTDSLFDYTQNLPESLKVLSDYGVLLFPTFWARIQRVIYRLGRDNPVSLASAFTTAELLDIDSAHIVGSNVFSKFGNGSILNSPELTIDALFPTGLY